MLRYLTSLCLLFYLILPCRAAYIADLSADYNEPGRTRLTWNYQKAFDNAYPENWGYYDIYATTSITNLSNFTDLTAGSPILLKKGMHYSRHWFDHVLGNYNPSKHQWDREYYYAVAVFKDIIGENMVYDDDVKGYIHPGNIHTTTEINTEGYASSSCLSNYSPGGWGTCYVFFNSAATPVDLSAYLAGSLTFYIKDPNSFTINSPLKLDTTDGVKSSVSNLSTYLNTADLTAGRWTFVQIPLADFGSFTSASSLYFELVPPIAMHYLVDAFGFNSKILTSFTPDVYAHTSLPLANRAVMSEKVLIGFNKTISPGYTWSGWRPDDYIGWPEDTDSVYSFPEEYSFDGAGAVAFGYNIEMWGGIGLGPVNVDFRPYNELRFWVRGYIQDHTMDKQPDNTMYLTDPNFTIPTSKAFSMLGFDIPIHDYEGWEEVRLPLDGISDFKPYWIGLELPARRGAFLIDNMILVDTNIWVTNTWDTNDFILLDFYPKTADVQRAKETGEELRVELLFNKPVNNESMVVLLGEDPNILKQYFSSNDAHLSSYSVSANRGNVDLDDNWIRFRSDPIDIDRLVNKKRTIYFAVSGGASDKWGNTIGSDFFWPILPIYELLYNVELLGKIINPEKNEAVLVSFNIGDPDNSEIAAYLLNSEGVPVKDIPFTLNPISTAQYLVIDGNDDYGNPLPTGMYILYLKEVYTPDAGDKKLDVDLPEEKIVKRTVYLR